MKDDTVSRSQPCADAGPNSPRSPHAGFAQTWWDFEFARSRFEDDLDDLLGADGFERIGGDHYDNSIEIYGARDNLRLSPEQQQFLIVAGFSKAYVNHTDGWETHYSWDHRDPKPVRAWRRKATDKGFLISHWPESWSKSSRAKDWLASGYMVIEPDPLDEGAARAAGPASPLGDSGRTST